MLPILLNLCLTSLSETPPSKLSSDQKSLLAASFLSNLDALSIPFTSPMPDDAPQVIHLSIRHLKKLSSLLQVFLLNQPPSSDTSSQTFTSLATTCLAFLEFNDATVPSLAWDALSIIMKIEFDVVLELMDRLTPRLQNATLQFLKALVVTNFKIRNGVEFIKQWTGLVKVSSTESAVYHEDLTRLYSWT